MKPAIGHLVYEMLQILSTVSRLNSKTRAASRRDPDV